MTNLFKKRKDGKIQFWYGERQGDKVRAISGLWENGPVESSVVTSKWKTLKATNVGKSNERNPEQQAEFELNKMYREQLESGYSEDINVPYMPDKVNPMLAEKYKAGVDYEGWAVQPKLDGVRCIVNSLGMWSREGKPIISAPHIFEALKPLLDKGMVFDGELYNHDLKEDFNKIISLVRKSKPSLDDLIESAEKVQYHIYDLVEEDLTYDERLDKLIVDFHQDNKHDCLKLVQTWHIGGIYKSDEEIYAKFLEEGYEGMMYRKPDSKYEFRRSKSLLKRKEFIDEEYKIVDIVEGVGNWAGFAKVVHCEEYKIVDIVEGEGSWTGTAKVIQCESNSKNFKATIKGNQDYCTQVLKEKSEYIGGQVTVRYQNLTPDGIPRFPIAVALYKGKRDL